MNSHKKQIDVGSPIELLFENDPRYSTTLSLIVVAVVAGFTIGIVTSLVEGFPNVAITLAAGAGVLVFALRLVRQKKIVPAGFIIAIIITGLYTLLATLGRGINDIVNIAIPSVLIIASLVLTTRQFWILTCLTIVGEGWIIFGAQFGAYEPLSSTFGSLSDFLIIVAILVVTGYSARAIAGIMRSSLQSANDELEERRKLQEQLDQNQLFLKAIINNIPFDLWVSDSDGRYIMQNATSVSIAGDLIGKTVYDLDFVPPESLDVYKAKHKLVLSGETIREEIQEIINGEERSLLSAQTPIQNIDGQIIGFIGMNIDVTNIRLAEKSLQESEEKYRALVENTQDVFYALEKDGEILFAGPQIERYGYQPEDVISKNILDFVVDADKEKVLAEFRKSNDGNRAYSIQFRVVDANGNLHWVEAVGHRQFDDNNQFTKQYGVLRNISERKKVETERETLITELQAKNDELEQFTYTVSHDLKAPLITISGFIGYLEEDALKGNIDRLKKDIQRIHDATSKMQRMLNELLELSRIGRMMNPPEDVPFGEIVQEALGNVRGQLDEGKIRVEVGGGLPIVHGDRLRLVAVVQNLLDNAAKFMGEQTEPEIHIGVVQKNKETVFFVRDNGKGIAPEYHERVFGLFNKLDASTGGTGIGLALVKRIVEVHGGRIWVESEAGQGATFFFTFGDHLSSPNPSQNQQR